MGGILPLFTTMRERIFLLIPLLAIVVFAVRRFTRRRRVPRTRFFPDAWHQYLMQHAALYRKWPPQLRPAWQDLILDFLGTKNFEGAGGLAVTQEMKLLIAAQACALLLGRKTRVYPRLRSIVIYPDEFTVPVHVEFSPGHHLAETEERLGESWRTGAVVLSWRNVVADGKGTTGRNVVLHEFAHQLDVENGAADGIPALPHLRDYANWARVLDETYETLRQTVAAGRFSALDPYAAKNKAELWAVSTEYFFEQPSVLRKAYPAWYDQLQHFYRLPPFPMQNVPELGRPKVSRVGPSAL